jgi:hypothetical protein
MALVFQQRQEAPSNVPAGAGEKNERFIDHGSAPLLRQL